MKEPILRLRKTSAMRMMNSFDHSGEDMSRKRQYDEALGDGEKNDDAENEELKEHVSKMMMDGGQDTANLDPPARERPAVSILNAHKLHHLFSFLYIYMYCILTLLHMKIIIFRMTIGHVSRLIE